MRLKQTSIVNLFLNRKKQRHFDKSVPRSTKRTVGIVQVDSNQEGSVCVYKTFEGTLDEIVQCKVGPEFSK